MAAFITSSSFAQTSWNFNLWATQTYTASSTTKDNLTVMGTDTAVEELSSSKTVNVNGNNITFSKYLKLPGTPTTTTRFIKFPVTGASKITVVYSHSSTAGVKRLLNFSHGSSIESAYLQSLEVPVASKTTANVGSIIYGASSASTIYISSGTNTVYVWGIFVTPITPDDTKALSPSKTWNFRANLTATDKENISADDKWSVASEKYTYTPEIDANTAVANFPGISLSANGTDISVTEGLYFGRANGKLDANRFFIQDGKYLNIVGKGPGFNIPNLKRNDILKVTFSTASNGNNRSLVLTNATSEDDLSNSDANSPSTVYVKVMSDGYVGFTGSEGLRYYEIVLNPQTNIDVNITAVGYATFSANRKFEVPEGLEAYTATFNSTTKQVVLSKISDNIIPAVTGVVLKGTPGDYTLYSTEEDASDSENDLKANIVASPLSAEEGAYTNFILASDGAGSVKFAKSSGNAEKPLAANKAYLQVPTGDLSGHELTISFADSETTGIGNLTPGLSQGEGVCFDLQGRKLSGKPTKGLYIVNGKKVIIK